MKKTCGALVIGLLITTNVYAKETKESFCNQGAVKDSIELLKKDSSFLKNWKPTELECKKIRFMLDSVAEVSFDNGFNEGAKHGMAVASDGIPPKVIKENCPPCDCSYNVPLQNNDIKRQQELDDARREQYYLDQNMNRHR